jgi:hypothetical protein
MTRARGVLLLTLSKNKRAWTFEKVVLTKK